MTDQNQNKLNIHTMTPDEVESIKYNENGEEPIIDEDGTCTFVLPADYSNLTNDG